MTLLMYIYVSENDLNEVKSLLMLGALANNTFISIVQGAVLGSSGNFIQPNSNVLLYQLQY